MASEHILNIKLQFEKLAPTALKQASKGIDKGIRESFEKGAIAGADAAINQIKSIQQAIKEMDWTRPIESIRNIVETTAARMKDAFGAAAIPIIGIFASIWKNIKEMVFDVQKDLVRMFSMMSSSFASAEGKAESMGTRVAKALSDINEVAFETTASIKTVKDQYISLAQQRVPFDDLKQLSKYAILGAKALGANQEQLTDMIARLRVMGGVSKELIVGAGGILRTFSKVQDAVGLTEQEMSAMIGTVSKLTLLMSAFGAAEQDIVAMTEATAKLTGMFGALGLTAGRANEIMEKLFDASRIGENALLVAKMGMNMHEYLDMLRGGPVDLRKLTEGLITAADEINRILEQGGNIVAANVRAQQMGFNNAQEALRLAKKGREQLAKIDSGEAAFEKQAAEGMATMSGSLERLMNTIGAFFGKRLAGIIGFITDILEMLNEWWLKNADSIDAFFDNATRGFQEFFRNLTPEKIINFFKSVGEGIGNVISFLQKAVPYIIAFLVVWKLGPPILGFLGNLASKIANVGNVAGGAAAGMGTFTQSVGAGLKMFLQMAGAALVMLAVGAAIFLIATGIGFLASQPWQQILIAAAILAIFVAGLVALGYFFMTPVGAIALAGMAAMAGVLLVLGIAIAAIGLGFMLIADNIMEMGKGLAFFAEIADTIKTKFVGLIKPLQEFGEAINEMLSAVKDKSKFKLFSQNLTDLAIGFYILSEAVKTLSEVQRTSAISASFDGLKKAIEAISVGPFIGNMKNAGEGFKALAEGIKTLASEDLTRMIESFSGSRFIPIVNFVSGLLEALKAHTGWFENIQRTGEGFQALAIGIYVLQQSADQLESLSGTMSKSAEGIGKFLSEMLKAQEGMYSMDPKILVALGQGFSELAIGLYILGKTDLITVAKNLNDIKEPLLIIMKSMYKGSAIQKAGQGLSQLFTSLSRLPSTIPRLSELAVDMAAITSVLVGFNGEASSAAKQFSKLMKQMEDAKPIRLISKKSEFNAELGEKKEELSIARSLNVAIQESFAKEVDRLMNKLSALEGHLQVIESASSRTESYIKNIKNLALGNGILVKQK